MVEEDWLVEQMCMFLKHTASMPGGLCMVLFAPFLPICDVFSGGRDFETRRCGSVAMSVLVGLDTASRVSCSYSS